MSTTSNAASLTAVLKEKLNAYFNRLKKEQEERSVEKEMHVYKIRSSTQNSDSDFTLPAFSPEDTYWMETIQSERFNDCNRRGILYRPKIVKEIMTMVDNAFNKDYPDGIMIKGPHGIGKSHSLVNLVRTLQYDSSCKYLVTMISDCQRWGDVDDLYTAICSSFGTSLSALSWSSSSALDSLWGIQSPLQNWFWRNKARLWRSIYTEWLRKSFESDWWGTLAGEEIDLFYPFYRWLWRGWIAHNSEIFLTIWKKRNRKRNLIVSPYLRFLVFW